MSKHTPGPWVIADDDLGPKTGALLGVYVAADWSRGGGMLAKAFANCGVPTDSECRANARLIAAAPDLMLAVENLLDAARDSSIPATHWAKEDAFAALNKARGIGAEGRDPQGLGAQPVEPGGEATRPDDFFDGGLRSAQTEAYAEGRKDERAEWLPVLEALKEIAAIEDLLVGSDWEEIEQARQIARAAIARITGSEA